METSELLKKVRKIEIKTKGLSKHIFSGEYHSAFKGRGMSFSEVRDYQFGDDVRNIDWNVTARTGDPHVKVFEEERELTVMLLVDVSRSSYFGTVNQIKQVILTEIAAVLSFSAIQNNDKVGLILFSEKIERFIPPKKGKQHILRIIRELLNFEPEATGTDLGMAIRYFNNVIKKRSICFILSDFMTQNYDDPLRIAARRHDLVGLHLYDPREQSLPNVGLMRAVDIETNQPGWIDTSSKNIREKYERHFQDNFRYFQNTFRKSNVDSVSIRTDESYVNALLKFFKKRAQ
ncbi:MAG: DUF58 domain-containing protein [Bacteroidetes bacterium]|nr:MAG: DUF58 domain-containing protein [Bacteroidota bacterium]